MAVLLFHLDLEFAKGGFLGVDLFFVISGFIITRNLVFDIDQGRFSLTDFYHRRIRRLLPALAVTILTTMVAAFTVLPTNELLLASKSALFSLFSLGNFNFWLESGYFDNSAHTKPLLHTWSLSVEEQFYLFWPGLVLLLRRARVFLVLGLLTTSIALAVQLSAALPDGVFYLLPFRVHQFMSGALLAVLGTGSSKGIGRLATVLGSIGFLLALASFSGATSPAGSAVSLSVIGFLLVAGCHSTPARLVYGNALMQWIGTRSYALYLVHWPLIVLFKYHSGFELRAIDQLGLGVVSVAGAVCLHELVEKPFRKRGPDVSALQRAAAPATFTLVAGTSLLAIGLLVLDGLPDDDDVSRLVATAHLEAATRRARIRFGECNLHREHRIEAYRESVCAHPRPDRQNVLVIGDSLGADTWLMLTQTYPDIYFGQATAGGCMGLLNPRRSYRTCNEFNVLRFTRLARKSFDLIVLASAWKPDAIPGLRQTVAYLRGIGRRVLVFGPRVRFPESVPLLISQLDSLKDVNETIGDMAVRHDDLLRAMRESLPDTPIVDMESLQCDPNCDVWSGSLLYVDPHHLSQSGSSLFGRRFDSKYDLREFLPTPSHARRRVH